MKYPRTPHLPFSPGATSDDKMLSTLEHFVGKTVVVTEKLDGECTGMSKDLCHARSLNSGDHPSRHWVKQLHGQLRQELPPEWHIYGENLFARHSIHYSNLPTYFFVFGIYNQNVCLSWGETKEWCALLGLHTVPELYYGVWDEQFIKDMWKGVSVFGEIGEGYVVRVVDSFLYDQFSNNVAKFVRANHVQTDEHWMQQEVVKNILQA